MSTICAEQHKLYPSQSQHQHFVSPERTFKDLELPPRKLLITKKSYHYPQESPDMSPYYDHFNLHKFLPCNDTNEKDGVDDNDDDMDPYSSDHFRMYEFKVRRCTRSRSHDWTDCPFAHPGEKARRRDPKKYHYSGAVCPEFRRGGCSRGDNCEFSHGVFECWLHPSRYRTEACKDGKNCKRKVCFFAHSPRQLRILPEVPPRKYDNAAGAAGLVSPCSFVTHGHCCCLSSHSVTSSPTSTLLGLSHLSPPLSPSRSPPLSPVKKRSLNGFSPILRYGDRLSKLRPGAISYKDVLTELITTLEALNFNESAAVNSPLSTPPAANHRNINIPWNIDASFDAAELEDPQQQFILSPSTPSPSSGGQHANFFNTADCSSHKLFLDDDDDNGGGMPCPDPDLGWVNDLLM